MAAKRGEQHHFAKLNRAKVEAARIRYAEGGISMLDLAIEHDVEMATMRAALVGRTWGPGYVHEPAASRVTTHCPQKHEYSPDNTRWYDRRGRKNRGNWEKKCVTCLRARGDWPNAMPRTKEESVRVK